jgi:hypothetical protein
VPKVYVIGQNERLCDRRDPEHASVAITHGLLTKLDKLELEA